MLTPESQSEFRLNDWQVRPRRNELLRDGQVIQLEPRVMAVLEVLASRPGEVFSRQELEDQVWQDMVVGYDALSKAINKLREALGDDKRQPRYIQTLSKKGYRLVATVHTDTNPAAQDTTPVQGSPKDLTRFKLLSGMFALGVVILVVVVLWPAGKATPPDQQAVLSNQKPTIVVLPFRNIGQSKDDDYLANGLTSDLTTNLSRLSGLWVTASNATLVYSNKDISTEQIKQEFSARYVISGEVNKSGNKIRINVHLNDIEKGSILWSERYDRQYTDLFTIQDDVTQEIIGNLSLTLTKEEQQRIAKRYTDNLEAYETFLRAQYLLNARTLEDNIQARELYKRAIDIDPGFARAYAGLSYSYAIGFLRQWPADTDKPLERALQLANKALQLDKDLPESYWAAAYVYFNTAELDKGTALLERALILNPNYADAYALLGANYVSQGFPERTLEIMTKAYKLNPIGGYLYDMQLGRAHYFLDNYELAIKYFDSAFERNPTSIATQMHIAAIYIRLGRHDDAGWMILEAKQNNPDFDPIAWANAYPFIDNRGFRQKLLADLRQAEKYTQQ